MAAADIKLNDTQAKHFAAILKVFGEASPLLVVLIGQCCTGKTVLADAVEKHFDAKDSTGVRVMRHLEKVPSGKPVERSITIVESNADDLSELGKGLDNWAGNTIVCRFFQKIK